MDIANYIDRLAVRDVDVDQALFLFEVRMRAEKDLPRVPYRFRIDKVLFIGRMAEDSTFWVLICHP